VRDEPRWWMPAVHLFLLYTLGGTLLALPFTGSLWPREVPDARPFLLSAAGVAVALTLAILQRARRLAVGAAVLIPVVVSAGWYAYEVRWNRELNEMAGGGEPAAIALVLRGSNEGWLWAIGANTVLGALAALAYAFYRIWRLERPTAASDF